MKRTLSILLSFLIVLILTLSAFAENLQPVIGDEAFSLALQEDRLALVPSEIVLTFQKEDIIKELDRYNQALSLLVNEQPHISVSDFARSDIETFTSKNNFRELLKYFTISPDGTKFFALNGQGVPFIYGINTGHLSLLAPKEEMESDCFRSIYRTIQQIEDRSVIWSPDGKYIALCFPYRVLAKWQLGSNIILIDTEAGTVVQLDKNLPAKVKFNEYLFGYPIRAVFSAEEPLLYYEVFSVEMPFRHNQIRSYNLQTGEIKTVSMFASDTTNIDSRLWLTHLGIMNTITSTDLKGPRGVSMHGPGVTGTFALRDPIDPYQLNLASTLLDYAQERAVLVSFQANTEARAQIIQLFNTNDFTGSIFNYGLAINPFASPQDRLVQLELDEIYTPTMTIPLASYSGYEIPVNAAFSPNGDYLLLIVNEFFTNPSVYIYDFNSEMLGRVHLPEELIKYGSKFALFVSGDSNLARGVKWLDNNRILAVLGGQYRVYDLVISPVN